MNRFSLLALVALAGVLCPLARAANVTSAWSTTTPDNWETALRWSNTPVQLAFPNNGADTYDATIGVSGTNYSVSIFSVPITINNFTLSSSSATVGQSNAFTVVNAFTQNAGTYNLSGNTLTTSVLNLNGGTFNITGGTLAPTNITLNGGKIVGGTVTTIGTGHLTVMNNGNNFLDGVTLNGGLVLDQTNGRVSLVNDANFNGFSATLSAAGVLLVFDTTATDSTATVSNATINMDGLNGRVGIERSSPVLTLAATATLRGRGSVNFGNIPYTATNTQLVNQGMVSADLSGQTLLIQPHVISNSGTMRAISGGTLTIDPFTSFTNSVGGFLSATGGSTLVLRKNWHNQGTLVLQDTSVLSLEGAFATADLGLSGWSRTGGSVNIVGAMNNAAATLDLNAIGSMTLTGGSITGGTIVNNTGTGRLFVNNNTSNILDAVTVTGGLTLDTTSRLRLRNDATVTGSIDLTNGSLFGLEATATDSTIALANTVNMNSNNLVALEGTSPLLTITSSGAIRGYGTLFTTFFLGGQVTSTVDNQGTISADVSGQSLTIQPYTMNNSGTVRALNGGTINVNPNTTFTNQPGGILSVTGGSTLNLQRNWHNQGTLILQDTSVVSLQGNFTTNDLGISGWSRTGGTVNLVGALNNTGRTLTLDATTGNITLAGGSITGGTLDNTSTTNGRLIATNNSANVLDGVTVTGGLIFDIGNSQIKLRNDTSIAGNVNFAANANFLYLDGTATDNTIVLTTKLTMNLDGTNANLQFAGTNPNVTFGPSVLVRGRGTLINGTITGTSSLTNQGRIVADLSGQTLNVAPNALTNSGSLEAQNGGALSIPTGLLNQAAGTIHLAGGFLQVTGNQAGPDITLGAAARLEGFGEVRFSNATTDSLSLSGTLAPDLGTGGLAIKGDLVLASAAVLAFDIAGTAQGTGYDFLSDAGSTALDLAGSTLRVTVANGYTPPNAQTFTIISSTQTIAGNFGNVASGSRITSTDGLWTFLVTRSGTTVTLSDAQPSPAAAFIIYTRGFYRGSTDPAITGPAADPDQDGVPNLLEFALKGDPASPGSTGLMAELMQDVDPAPSNEFTLIIAVRTGAVFTQQPDGSQKNVSAIDSLHYSVQGSSTLGTFPLPVLHLGPSFTAPAAAALPDLTGSGWEYHTFYVAPAAITTRGFMRVTVDGGP